MLYRRMANTVGEPLSHDHPRRHHSGTAQLHEDEGVERHGCHVGCCHYGPDVSVRIKIPVKEENVLEALQGYESHERHHEPGKALASLAPEEPCHHAVEHETHPVDKKYVMNPLHSLVDSAANIAQLHHCLQNSLPI